MMVKRCDSVAIDRRMGDGAYGDILDVCAAVKQGVEELGISPEGTKSRALAKIARESRTFRKVQTFLKQGNGRATPARG